jgi:hypothetical protein
MKNIVISTLIGLLTITASIAATREYESFAIPFKQSKDAERVLIEIPSLPVDYKYGMLFPEPGTYILNKPEVLKREIERTGTYYVYPKFFVITTFIAVVILVIVFAFSTIGFKKN